MAQQQSEIGISGRLDEFAKVVAWVEAFGAEHGLPGPIVNDVNLVLDEILSNVVAYAYPDDAAGHVIRVTLDLEADALVVQVEDDGDPFDPVQTPAPAIAA